MEPDWDDAKLPQLFREFSTRAPNVTSHATNIQAAFRGHHVRCNISDDLPWDIADGQHNTMIMKETMTGRLRFAVARFGPFCPVGQPYLPMVFALKCPRGLDQ